MNTTNPTYPPTTTLLLLVLLPAFLPTSLPPLPLTLPPWWCRAWWWLPYGGFDLFRSRGLVWVALLGPDGSINTRQLDQQTSLSLLKCCNWWKSGRVGEQARWWWTEPWWWWWWWGQGSLSVAAQSSILTHSLTRSLVLSDKKWRTYAYSLTLSNICCFWLIRCDGLVNWLINWLVNWLTDWLVAKKGQTAVQTFHASTRAFWQGIMIYLYFD